jgi:hypothetical protein
VPAQPDGCHVTFRDDVFDAHADVGVIVDGLDDLSEAFTAPDLAFAETLVVDIVRRDRGINGPEVASFENRDDRPCGSRGVGRAGGCIGADGR